MRQPKESACLEHPLIGIIIIEMSMTRSKGLEVVLDTGDNFGGLPSDRIGDRVQDKYFQKTDNKLAKIVLKSLYSRIMDDFVDIGVEVLKRGFKLSEVTTSSHCLTPTPAFDITKWLFAKLLIRNRGLFCRNNYHELFGLLGINTNLMLNYYTPPLSYFDLHLWALEKYDRIGLIQSIHDANRICNLNDYEGDYNDLYASFKIDSKSMAYKDKLGNNVSCSDTLLRESLNECLGSESYDLRTWAIDTISRMNPAREVMGLLVEALNDKAESVRLVAAGILGNMGRDAADVIHELEENIKMEENGAVLVTANAALKRIKANEPNGHNMIILD